MAYLRHAGTTLLTGVVVGSFLMSSLGWRHIECSERKRILVAAAILVVMYALMIFELVNRNLAALIGAAASVAAYDCLVEYVEMEHILDWEDLETLSLLFGMMIIVNVLATSGLFDYLAVWCYRKSGGHFWTLVTIMSLITATLSATIDNVSTMLLMAPTLIKLAELEHIDPRYLLMIMVVFCNIGGCATPVGDPPNLVIIGDKLIQELGITFTSFVAYCAPCVLVTIAALLAYLRLRYKSKNSFRMPDYVAGGGGGGGEGVQMSSRANGQHQAQLEVRVRELTTRLRRVAAQSGGRADDKAELAELDRQIESIEEALLRPKQQQQQQQQLQQHQQQQPAKRDQLTVEFVGEERRGSRLNESEILQLLRTHSIKSVPVLALSLGVLLVTIVLFFLQSLPNTRLTLGWISLFAGLTLLVSSSSINLGPARRRPHDDDNDDHHHHHQHERRRASTASSSQSALAHQDDRQSGDTAADHDRDHDHEEDQFEKVINNIEWSTLMFFFALFIVMEVMAKLGLIDFVGDQITSLISQLPAGRWRSFGAISVVLWASGLASASIDNVPFTSMMIKVLGSMAATAADTSATSGEAPLDMRPLVFALAFGACYGGNGTLIGASANLVTAGVSGRQGYPISFNTFFMFAGPATLISLAIAHLYLVVVFVLLGL